MEDNIKINTNSIPRNLSRSLAEGARSSFLFLPYSRYIKYPIFAIVGNIQTQYLCINKFNKFSMRKLI